jgi:hypothetical protein
VRSGFDSAESVRIRFRLALDFGCERITKAER